MRVSSVRQSILKVFTRTYSLTLKSEAIEWLEDLVEQFEIADQDVADTMDHIASSFVEGEDNSSIVTRDALDRVYKRLQASNGPAAPDSPSMAMEQDDEDSDTAQYLKVINAFDMPRINWSFEKKAFERAAAKPSMVGAATSKAQYLRDRFGIAKQVILRSEYFCPPAVGGHDRNSYPKITSVKNLLGRQGGDFTLFGLLARTEIGQFCLEDLDDRVVLDFSEARQLVKMITQGSFVLVFGRFTSESIFFVSEITHPPAEGRNVTKTIFGHVDFLGTGALTHTEETRLLASEKAQPNAFVVISDLFLNQPKVLLKFRAMLQALVTADAIPAVFVLCGNFSSIPFLLDGKSTLAYTQYFSALAEILLSFPQVLQQAHFVLVPGPHDPFDTMTLPRPPLPAPIVKALMKIPKITFATNPCRITYKSQEIVVLRDDLLSRVLRNCVWFDEVHPTGEIDDEQGTGLHAQMAQNWQPEHHLAQLVLDQGHLCPLPISVRPVLWEYDHTLRLYPMPTALVLADKYSPYEITYDLGPDGEEGRCHVFNPGSFVSTGYGWSTYKTDERIAEQCGLPP
ncbi:uncharacterized protein L969DRAFT_84704 [Mixia osmundae IAM 14324]|uniref:DNA polymerase epsilon subunit n=1 Tax=Mixia osmundae (strain CBS 9802 / IAM 14324 / JCM 22182 / KY 12970) TaxID=764103 RepID=G7DTJ8_MIXOS|nr:uncharacterized protein L969DRAFT_84704 [Mixia osmundae IAM 14324]KEI42818.1 hypothetical protein L969DRAFT_84704 [Mixia osmundae IAM 14324]GAA93845.1 hypothetical protein E5Q_00491 [Mixia osmundae IAM 14324]